MSYDRKLMRNGNGWELSINSTILKFLDVDPNINMVQYTIENDKLIISKSDKLISEKNSDN